MIAGVLNNEEERKKTTIFYFIIHNIELRQVPEVAPQAVYNDFLKRAQRTASKFQSSRIHHIIVFSKL